MKNGIQRTTLAGTQSHTPVRPSKQAGVRQALRVLTSSVVRRTSATAEALATRESSFVCKQIIRTEQVSGGLAQTLRNSDQQR